MPENAAPSREIPSYTCGGCDNRWRGLSRCHCAACHRTFSGVDLFDRHRVARKCADPALIVNLKTGEPIMRLADGVWRSTREWSGPGA